MINTPYGKKAMKMKRIRTGKCSSPILRRRPEGIKRLCILLLGAILMFSLFGCGKKKYKLLFDGYGFDSRKTEYAAGEKVTVTYDLIATDTDYQFWLDDDGVALDQDYDPQHGYVFTFTMPERDVTLHMSSRNSMIDIPRLSVTFVNEVEEADIWILPQTEENLKTSLWGTASIRQLGTGESAEVVLNDGYDAASYILRIIDDDHAFYSVNDLKLLDGYTIVFKYEGSKYDAVLEVYDENKGLIDSRDAFTGMLGAG